ncbi:MAG: dNTP triphosphohydrolase [Porphyromonas sp.]|nr:dNTP triphosphohydrolase [Porphyromonas sp.]
MRWEQLLQDTRLGMEDYHMKSPGRTDFQRDYDRLIFSAPFRRLQNKTQVFPLPGKVFVHNRLTHSLEVACVGRSLGNNAGRILREKNPKSEATFEEMGSIVAAACLAHDMGNPPFGHSGERAISAYFNEGHGAKYRDEVISEGGRWADFGHFEGNANAFRLLTHSFKGRRDGGFALTYSTLASIVKYPCPSHCSLALKKKKYGYFQTEEDTYLTIADRLGIPVLEEENGTLRHARYPLVYLVEAADDICYQLMDMEDAFKLKLIDEKEVKDIMYGFLTSERTQKMQKIMNRVTDKNEQIAYIRSVVIGTLVEECTQIFTENEDAILSGTFKGALTDNLSTEVQAAFKHCAETAKAKVYCAGEVKDIEMAGFTIFGDLLERLIIAQKYPDRAYSQLWFGRVSEQYDLKRPTLYGKIQTALDYISGMTDIYALDLYRTLTGMSLPAV